jgi:hypothetical protein
MNFTMVVKKKLKSKSRRGGKAKKADDATEAVQLLKLKLQLTLLNNYENNHSIILRIKLFIVYPFFLLFVLNMFKFQI